MDQSFAASIAKSGNFSFSMEKFRTSLGPNFAGEFGGGGGHILEDELDSEFLLLWRRGVRRFENFVVIDGRKIDGFDGLPMIVEMSGRQNHARFLNSSIAWLTVAATGWAMVLSEAGEKKYTRVFGASFI